MREWRRRGQFIAPLVLGNARQHGGLASWWCQRYQMELLPECVELLWVNIVALPLPHDWTHTPRAASEQHHHHQPRDSQNIPANGSRPIDRMSCNKSPESHHISVFLSIYHATHFTTSASTMPAPHHLGFTHAFHIPIQSID